MGMGTGSGAPGGRLAHAAALGGAAAACGSAVLAMLCMVVLALVGARVADIGAQLAYLMRVLARAAQQLCCQAAYPCALIVEDDAAGHHSWIDFLQAGCGAGIARLGAFVTCLDT